MVIDTFRKLYDMLEPRERLHFYVLLGLILITGLLDMIGVAAIVPFLMVLSDPSVIEKSEFLSVAQRFLDPPDTEAFLFQLGLGIFAIIVLGTLVKVFTMYALARFSHMRRYHIGRRLLTVYLRQPYEWFLSRHSSDLAKTVIHEVDQMVGSTLVPAMRILAQTVSMLLLLALLLIVQPMIALIVFSVLGGAYFIIFFFVRRSLNRLGQDRIRTNTGRFRIAGEALGGIKDVKIMGLETSYSNRYRGPAWAHARTLVNIQLIGELPRYVLEATTFGGIVLLILLLMQQNGGLSEGGALSAILPVLGLFAVAGLRMLPAIQNIYHSLTSLRSGQAVLNVVHGDLMSFQRCDADVSPPTGIRLQLGKRGHRTCALPLARDIELRDITYSYPGTERAVLDGISIRIPARSTVGVVGGTGAGKTTLIDIILGLLQPDKGSLFVDGVALDTQTIRIWQDQVGYVPQQIFLTDDTIAANIAFGVAAKDIDMDAVRHAARLAHLNEFIETELVDGYETSVGERGVRLSGGQRQRIGIARALYHDPEVLIFDEATSALDTMTENAIMEAVDSLGRAKTIILIAHRLTTVEKCDRIFLLEKGKVADSGRYDELISRSMVFQRMARVEEKKSEMVDGSAC